VSTPFKRHAAAMPSGPAPIPVPSGNASLLSFAEVYRQWADAIARWAQRLGGALVDVDDVVQEVFLVVSRHLGRFRGDDQLSPWLFEVTRKITANHRRRHRWRWLPAAETSDQHPSPCRSPEADLERREAIGQLYEALDRLPEKYRTVIVLFEIEGLSTQQIAELRQLKLSTVRVQLGRARQSLLRQYRSRRKGEL